MVYLDPHVGKNRHAVHHCELDAREALFEFVTDSRPAFDADVVIGNDEHTVAGSEHHGPPRLAIAGRGKGKCDS
jgi:hypothetical protein